MSEAEEDRCWQRLDKWLWHARFLKTRSECSRLVEGGLIRLNRQPTEKAHARLRAGDILTLPAGRPDGSYRGGALGGHDVRVIRVLALALRRGPAPEARLLYEEILELPG